MVENAKKILASLESQVPVKMTEKVIENTEEENELQLSFSSGVKEDLIQKLKVIDVNTLTPIEAMTVLFELQKEAQSL